MKRQLVHTIYSLLVLPSEIWLEIFLMCPEEWYLTKAVAVSHAWENIIRASVDIIGVVGERWTTVLDDRILQRVPKLKMLHTHAIQFHVTDAGFKSLTGLTSLYLDVTLRNLTPYALTCLTNLTYLYCMPELYLPCKSSNLNRLHIDNNPYIYDKDLLCFNHLTRLDINSCYNVTTDCIRKLTTLVRLDITRNDNFDLILPNLTNLTHLSNRTSAFVSDVSLYKLTKLTHLSLMTSASITGKSLLKLCQLTHLCISGNRKIAVTASTPSRLQSIIQPFYRRDIDFL